MKYPCAKRISPVPYSTLRIGCAKWGKGRPKLAAPGEPSAAPTRGSEPPQPAPQASAKPPARSRDVSRHRPVETLRGDMRDAEPIKRSRGRRAALNPLVARPCTAKQVL